MEHCNGGYIMVDCAGLDLLAQSTQTIPGIYSRALAAFKSKKPVIAANMVYGVDAISPVPVFMVLETEGRLIATASVVQIIMAKNDTVTIVNLAPAE